MQGYMRTLIVAERCTGNPLENRPSATFFAMKGEGALGVSCRVDWGDPAEHESSGLEHSIIAAGAACSNASVIENTGVQGTGRFPTKVGVTSRAVSGVCVASCASLKALCCGIRYLPKRIMRVLYVFQGSEIIRVLRIDS